MTQTHTPEALHSASKQVILFSLLSPQISSQKLLDWTACLMIKRS